MEQQSDLSFYKIEEVDMTALEYLVEIVDDTKLSPGGKYVKLCQTIKKLQEQEQKRKLEKSQNRQEKK